MNQTLLKDYSKVVERRKAIEVEESTLKTAILEMMLKRNTDREETPYGCFSVARRPNYTYSKKVTKLQEAVDLRKIDEVDRGIASKGITEYVLFKPAE